ncbi:hypothetical protein [Corynebacterium kalidii]|uniref:YbjN domain-containing protein n=1 Tax=Corynebacterium kalidii TaxID=2931982 RepID=A0A9X2AYD0_9CORY|nr:hypothetical protein [Corynebacterium kalidii]MCJ7857458.1 hypothetical protein [Corynebacterium kalidii]
MSDGATCLWLQSAAIGLDELDLDGLDLRIEVSGSSESPLTHDAVMDWHGVLDGLDPIDIQRLVNAWNDRFVAPRVFSYEDSQGHTRLRGEMIMTWWEGHTVAQLDEYLRAVVFGAMNLNQWLDEQWPQAERHAPDIVAQPGGVGLGGEDRGVAATEEMAAQFITPGNASGFASGDTTPVTPHRIAEDLASRSGQLSPVDDDGVLRIRWGQPAVNIAVNGDVLSVSSSAEVMLADPENADPLLPVTWRWSTNRAGAVAVVHRNSDGSTSVIYALHQFVGAGMTDRQLQATVSQTCELVADCMMALADEITG